MKYSIRVIIATLLIFTAAGSVAFFAVRRANNPISTSGKPIVVVTVPHMAVWLDNIAAGSLEVRQLMPPGTDAHDFSLTPSAAASLSSAALLVANGAGLEPWLEDVIELVPETPVLELATNVQTIPGDPHVWLDPVLAITQVKEVSQAIMHIVPENDQVIIDATDTYVQKLQALDREIQDQLGPLKQRSFIAFHNSFSYFAQRYSLTQAANLVERPQDQVTFAELASLGEIIKDQNLDTLFIEPGPIPDIAQTVADEFGVALVVLDPLERIKVSPDAYVTAMRNNLAALVTSLR